MDRPRNRNIYMSENFTNESVQKITQEIIEINEDDDLLERKLLFAYNLTYDRLPIKIYIDSYGGMVYSCIGLISIIENSKTPIHTIVTGSAFSAGFLLLICGHKRFAYKKSSMMYHQIAAGSIGKLLDMEDRVDVIKKLHKMMTKYTISKTKITKEQLKDNYIKKKDWYMDAEESLELGIIDEII